MDSTIKEDIEKANMDIQSLNLLTEGSVPDDADCLFIDSPSTDISEDEKTAIIDYLENGGKAMIFSDYTTEDLPNFDAVLENYGVQREAGIVFEGDNQHYAMQMPYYLVPTINSTDASSETVSGGYYVLTPYGYKYVVAWNKMYSAQVFENNLFDKGKLYEDEYLNFRLFWEIKSVAIVHTSLYCYVQRQGSITQSDMSIKKIKMKEEIHKCRISFYKEHRERHLYMKSCQMYCNWLVECVRQYSQVLQPVDKRRFQLEMRKYSRIADDDKEFGMAIRIQNYVGRISLRLASFFKRIYKGDKNVREKHG